MSKSSHLELHAQNSQILCGEEYSVSLPSEPHDIRKWFPSYVYESPELNTLDGLQDFDGLGETCVHEEKKGICGENQHVGKSNDGLLSVVRNSSHENIERNEFYELGYDEGAAVVKESSESLSFSSEPPDIKNWFSSYLYESLPLDTTHDFTISDYKVREDEDGKLSNGEKNCKQDTKDFVNFIDVEERIELATRSKISDAVKCSNLDKDANLDYQPVGKDVHNVALSPMSSIPSRLISKNVSNEQRIGNNDLGSVEKARDTSTYGKDNDTKLGCILLDRTISKLSNEETNIGSRDGKSVHKLIGMKDHGKDRRTGKENKEAESFDNGFVSIRKSNKANGGNLTKPVQVEFESLRHGVKAVARCEKNGNISRKVLSETSNFLSPGVVENIGKWRCPQKNKPNLGPPMKQLRLEQWLRRV